MSASIPPAMEGSHTPSSLEFLWDKHRRSVITILVAVACALGLNYGVRYYVKAQTNAKWSRFAEVTQLRVGYAGPQSGEGMQAYSKAYQALPTATATALAKTDGSDLEKLLSEASGDERPFLLWTAACRAVLTKEFDKATDLLDRLKGDYPSHSLCVETGFPVQYRKPEKPAEGVDDSRNKKPSYEAPQAGSLVSRLRGQIDRVRSFTLPAHFSQPELPPDLPKVKLTFAAGFGEVVIALREDKAPKHVAKFLELVDAKHWDGMRVDQIFRTGTGPFAQPFPMQLHIGLESSRQDDRTLWVAQDESKHVVEWEDNDLSHFAGTLAGQPTGDGKSSADRLWFAVEDNAPQDGNRVIFGRVVSGLDVLRRICESGFATQAEEESGVGKPQDNITVLSVTRE